MQWDNNSKHKSSASLKSCIKNKKDNGLPIIQTRILLKTCSKHKDVLEARIYKDIKSLNEDILDQWSNLDESYWMYLTESISRRLDTWILRMED